MVCCEQAVTPGMMEQGSGIIVGIGSTAGYFVVPFSGVYSSSKAGLNMLMDTLRMEVSPWGVKVLTIATGFFKSKIVDNAEGWVSPSGGSVYDKIKSSMLGRAHASQNFMTTVTAEKVARKIVGAFHKRSPPNKLSVGGLTASYKFLGSLEFLFPSLISKRLVGLFDLRKL